MDQDEKIIKYVLWGAFAVLVAFGIYAVIDLYNECIKILEMVTD